MMLASLVNMFAVKMGLYAEVLEKVSENGDGFIQPTD